MLCSLFAPRLLSRQRTTSALFIVCSEIVVQTENHECSVHCLLCERCQDGEPRVLCSLFAPRSLSRRRTTSALFSACSEIVVTTENHECSVRCLIRDRCQDGEPRVLCSLFALRSLSRRRTTSALLIACSALVIACSEIVVRTENHECSVHCLLCSVNCLLCDRCQDGEPRVLCLPISACMGY